MNEATAISEQREKNLKNWNSWAWHKNLVDEALFRFLQTPSDNAAEILNHALKTYRNSYERKVFSTPLGGVYRANAEPPPETYRFR